MNEVFVEGRGKKREAGWIRSKPSMGISRTDVIWYQAASCRGKLGFTPQPPSFSTVQPLTPHSRRKTEADINAFPHFTALLSTGGHNYTVHFMALFSEKKDAIPVVMTHGWPGEYSITFLIRLSRLCLPRHWASEQMGVVGRDADRVSTGIHAAHSKG